MRIALIVGTRPEAIKLAPVVWEAQRRRVDTLLVSTGQHREMLDQTFNELELQADVDLQLMRPRQRLSDLSGALISRVGDTLRRHRPDWVIVQGDTSTAFLGALAAYYEQIPIAHVEAGLRTGNLRSPFPEEANRRLLAPLAALHFCPTDLGRRNLLAEAIDARRTHVVGNTVIDALRWAVKRTRGRPPVLEKRRPRRILLTLHRRENHGTPMCRVLKAIQRLAAREDVEIVFPVHKNPEVREAVGSQLRNVSGIHLCEPLSYLDLVGVLDSSDLVLTDSGGLQEEAPTLGKPVLVLRDTTERPEAVETGAAKLVGTDADMIFEMTSALLDDKRYYSAMARAVNPYGDGHSARRIVTMLRNASRDSADDTGTVKLGQLARVKAERPRRRAKERGQAVAV